MKKPILLIASFAFFGNMHAQDDSYNLDDVQYDIPEINEAPRERDPNNKNFRILKQFASPIKSTYLDDVEFDGKFLWVNGYEEGKIYQISPENGKVIRDLSIDITRTMGLAFDGKHLWLVDQDNMKIEQIDPQTGNVINTIKTPAAHNASYPSGLCWDGKYFWHNDPKGYFIESSQNDSTFMMTPDGKVVKGFKAHGGYPTGLAFDGKYLWSCDNEFDVIHKINPETFEIIETYNAPGGDYPNGLTFDGKYLWITNNDVDSIYAVEITTNKNQAVTWTAPNDSTLLAQSINIGPVDSLVFDWNGINEINAIDEEITEIPVGMLCTFIPPMPHDENDEPVIVTSTIEETDPVDKFSTETPALVAAEIVEAVAYPNPTNGPVKFQLMTDVFLENTKVIVYDITGKQLIEKTFEGNELMLDLGPYDSGVFMYTIVSNGKILKSGRLVKEGRK